MKITADLNIKQMSTDLIKVKAILALTDNMATAEVCNLYIALCQHIAAGIVPDSTTEIMQRLKEEFKDSEDRPERHSIAGHMNDPSDMQAIAFDKENEDKFTDPSKEELCNGWMK